MTDIIISIEEDMYSFKIMIEDKVWHFDKNESVMRLVDVFEELGFESTYKEETY